jgi:hypothetical protein
MDTDEVTRIMMRCSSFFRSTGLNEKVMDRTFLNRFGLSIGSQSNAKTYIIASVLLNYRVVKKL